MKKNYIILFLALVLSTLSFAQNFNAIEPELQKVLNQRGEELIDIQIYFKSSIDSERINQATRKAYTKAEKKDFVVRELKSYSASVQADVMSILEAEELSGNVSDIHNLWIANSINCKASRSVIYKLSTHPDIKVIGYDEELQLISPEQMKEASSTSNGKLRGAASHVTGVNADDVWAQGYTGKNVVVAVLDSGTNTNHLDLKDHLWSGYVDTNNDGTPDSYVNGWNYISNNSNITDDYGHGTHCAGIVCGDGTTVAIGAGLGSTTGIAPDALLMTLKTINRTGGGSVAQMLSGVQFAVENGADVLSMSLGFKNSQLTATQKETIRSTFDKVLAAGVVVCAAAGNDGDNYGAPDNVDYPAACPAPWTNPDQTLKGGNSSVICVGAHDLGMSSRGPSTWEGTSYNDYPYNEGASMGLIRPDISAPGNYIYSLNYTANNLYAIKSGTSQATPCVAGVIALMLEKNSSLTPAQISQILEETAQSKPAKKNNTVGAGIVDALAAVNSITEVVGNPFIQVSKFAPQAISTGKQTIVITLNNTGNGASDENTSVTLSLSNDPYITIANPTQNVGRIGANSNKTLFFELDVDTQTPSGHTATFSVNTTSGSLSWDNAFSINITSIPEITFQSVSPAVVKTNTSTDINVTIANTGTAAFSDSIKLKLVTISSDLKHVTLVDNETSIKPLGVGETGTGTFTIETKTPSEGYKFDFFLETYSEYSNPTNYVYEFENDLQGWSYFNASSNYIKAPWLHSTNATTLTDIHDSHSGKGHLMSVTYRDGAATNYTPIDNYLVSPVKIKATENSKISFYACANNYSLYREHFGLAISTAGNTSASDFTTVQDWVIDDRTTWKQYTVDLSAYAGQEIYVAIRHFFTAQEWEDSYYGYDYCALNIDDIVFSDVTLSIKHITTYSYDDPYYFNVMVSNTINLPMVENLTATAVSSSKISLTWDAVNNVNGYNVYRDGQKIATVTEPTFEDSKLNHETQYCYAVTTITSYGESGLSEETCATTLKAEEPAKLDAPTNLRATIRQDVPDYDYKFEITVAWDAVEGAKGYDVFVNTEKEQDFHMGYTNGTAYVIGTNQETTFEFYVVAFNDETESDPSEIYTVVVEDDAIEEVNASFNVYPNPVNDKLYIETEEIVKEVVVYDVYGRQQKLSAISGQPSVIDVTNLNSGVYFVKVVTENGEAVQRFVKK